MDSNITIDEEMGTVELDVNDIKVGDVTMKTFKFFNVRNFYYALYFNLAKTVYFISMFQNILVSITIFIS